jgi:hypothetical protein
MDGTEIIAAFLSADREQPSLTTREPGAAKETEELQGKRPKDSGKESISL